MSKVELKNFHLEGVEETSDTLAYKLRKKSMEHCIHSEPQAASSLHGVCIFCYRNRLAEANNRLAKQMEANGDLTAQIYGMQDGALIRDLRAKNQRLEEALESIKVVVREID